jgi:tetratricopeptide (TPR) repeat protein
MGCTEVSQQTVSPESVPPHSKVAKPEDLPKRTPMASTCVKFGDLRLRGVMKGDFQGAEREASLEQARLAYEQALKIDPKNMEAFRGLGQLHQQTGNYSAALAAFHKGLNVNPACAFLWYELGMCEARHGDWNTSVENLKKASDVDPESREFTRALAFALARTGRINDSVTCFQRIMGESQAHYNVARLLHHFNQDGASQQQLQLALQTNPNNAPAMELLAELQGQINIPNQGTLVGQVPVPDQTPPAAELSIDDAGQELEAIPGNAN